MLQEVILLQFYIIIDILLAFLNGFVMGALDGIKYYLSRLLKVTVVSLPWGSYSFNNDKIES